MPLNASIRDRVWPAVKLSNRGTLMDTIRNWPARALWFTVIWAVLVPVMLAFVTLRFAFRMIFPGKMERFSHLGIWRLCIRRTLRPPAPSLRLRDGSADTPTKK